MPATAINPIACTPLSREEFSILIASAGPFESNPKLAVAVSGGADSMALMLLAQQWAKSKGGSVVVLTVDHGLRSAAKEEVRQVRAWCEAQHIEHHVLRIQDSGFGIQGKIQESARLARYSVLTSYCRQHHILHILTAHHRDDQAETLFFRTARASGIDGLACMPLVADIMGIRLIRPLLPIPKSRLTATLEALNQPWIEDPSNQNLDYTRNALRQKLRHSRDPESLSQQAYSLTQDFGKIRNLLDNKLASHIANNISLFPEGYARLDNDTFLQLPAEYGLRLLSNVIMTLAGDAYAPRSEKLKRLYDEIVNHTIKGRRSFAGLLFIRPPLHSHWLICREPNSMEEAIMLPAETGQLWDRRFMVTWSGSTTTMTLRALGRTGIKLLPEYAAYDKKRLREKAILSCVPSLWHLEELIAVPHIRYINAAYPHITANARFLPAKPLAGPAFFSMNG